MPGRKAVGRVNRWFYERAVAFQMRHPGCRHLEDVLIAIMDNEWYRGRFDDFCLEVLKYHRLDPDPVAIAAILNRDPAEVEEAMRELGVE